MSAKLFAVLLLATTPALADDLGESLRFQGESKLEMEAVAPTPGGELVYEGTPSAPQNADNDTVLFHGEMTGKDVVVEASRRDAAGNWLPWKEAYVKRYPNGRFWAKAELPLGREPVRLRVRGKNGKRLNVKIYSVEAFKAADRETPPAAPKQQTAVPTPDRPAVHGRAEWGASKPKDEYEPQTPERMTLHHTDGKYTQTLADSLIEAKVIQDFHMHGRGWSDIAYHYLIDSAGNILEGRPELVVGAHAGDHAKNLNNVGIVFLGTFHAPKNDPVTPQSLDALVSLARYLSLRYKIKPAQFKGHRDFKQTDCPGDELYALLPQLRGRISVPPTPRLAPNIFRPILLLTPRFE